MGVLLVHPDPIEDWRYINVAPDIFTERKAHQIFYDFHSFNFFGDAESPQRDGMPYLRFADDAQEVFSEWLESHQRCIRERGTHTFFPFQLTGLSDRRDTLRWGRM